MNRIVFATAGIAGLVLLAACSSTPTAPASSTVATSATNSTSGSGPLGSPASGPHNDADVAFAAEMIPHHAQAVQMSTMAAAQATNTQVKALAADIKSAQNPEITTMTGWLVGWGQPAPATSTDTMGGMDMGSTGTGMMSSADMTSLGKATGATFDRMWVQMMVTHHTGAIDMARTELATGANPDTKALAQSIISSQTAQIAQLAALLKQLPSA